MHNDAARQVVRALASWSGFRPVFAGPIAAARELEALAWMNIRLQRLVKGSWTTAFALVGAPEGALA